MGRENSLSVSQTLVLIGGFVALLYTFYYMQQLSYSIGIYSGIAKAITAYNITSSNASSALIGSLSQSGTLALALHLTYALLPFAVLMLAIGVIWFFSRSYSRLTATLLVICSVIYIIIVALLEFDFSFSGAAFTFPLAYIGGIFALGGGAYNLLRMYNRQPISRRTYPISINPDTPYSNMRLLSSRLMRRLSGDIKILDMHFDINALDNLMQLIERHMQQYAHIYVITSAMRLGNEFSKPYSDFKNELANRNVEFELRVLAKDDAAKQHERVLMDGNAAYKIPPLNIINRKNEHIVGINVREAQQRFDRLWSKATKFENMRP
jgi:hypothetical protein